MEAKEMKKEFDVITKEELEKIVGGANRECIDECYRRAREDKDGYALQECLKSCVRD